MVTTGLFHCRLYPDDAANFTYSQSWRHDDDSVTYLDSLCEKLTWSVCFVQKLLSFFKQKGRFQMDPQKKQELQWHCWFPCLSRNYMGQKYPEAVGFSVPLSFFLVLSSPRCSAFYPIAPCLSPLERPLASIEVYVCVCGYLNIPDSCK